MVLFSSDLTFQPRYNDIAKYGFFAIENHGSTSSKIAAQKDLSATRPPPDTSDSDKATDLEGYVLNVVLQFIS